MAKEKIQYVCTACGYDSPKWIGRCPSCGEWNTFAEQRVGGKQVYDKRLQFSSGTPQSSPVKVRTIESTEEPRINLCDDELNRVLGGGLVPGSLVLLGGEPGIGKSTLILQTALGLKDKTVLYVSGEESARQIKLRADRITQEESGVLVVCESMIENIFKHIEDSQPDIVVIDSIQTMATQDVESAPGSISQIRECAALLLKYAKETNIPIIIIGHITKEGTIAEDSGTYGRYGAAVRRRPTLYVPHCEGNKKPLWFNRRTGYIRNATEWSATSEQPFGTPAERRR